MDWKKGLRNSSFSLTFLIMPDTFVNRSKGNLYDLYSQAIKQYYDLELINRNLNCILKLDSPYSFELNKSLKSKVKELQSEVADIKALDQTLGREILDIRSDINDLKNMFQKQFAIPKN